jgi:hypothetical protein
VDAQCVADLLGRAQIVNIADKTHIHTTASLRGLNRRGRLGRKPLSKDPTRIELALDYVKQWSYLGG